ncbi:hypothetical protein DOTSEDRAFT_44269 [Dothistroma septosporum NZE10]|uniref:Uncharacterized protein n=1 Tax=Dothistroma septosporum (strain NZE10 / CBS 128990) TaxID=675120 RepID=N1PKC5_DOTSN|nr:hypothetical protein DOTSEDRAFT_44269 [Dothistroma septosporum NZE10]
MKLRSGCFALQMLEAEEQQAAQQYDRRKNTLAFSFGGYHAPLKAVQCFAVRCKSLFVPIAIDHGHKRTVHRRLPATLEHLVGLSQHLALGVV